MSFPGFVPVRQLVLVDLLSLILSVRPGERAIVAIDGVDEISRSHVTREVMALAQHLAGRQLVTVGINASRHAGSPAADNRAAAAYSLGAFDDERFLREVWRPFRIDNDVNMAPGGRFRNGEGGGDVNMAPGGRFRNGEDELVDCDDDALLLVDGVFCTAQRW
ncbi:MAG: hypothetical protein WBG36_02030 [Ornithinimicrobium sp.]